MCGLATFPDPMGMTVARPSRRGLLVPAAAVCLAVLAPFALASLVLFLLGWHLQPILSASMRPSYPSGALVAVEPIDASQVRPGMVIVFVDPRQPGRLVAHRVVEQVSGDRLAFRTRGDANVVDDPFPVSAESVQGRVRWGSGRGGEGRTGAHRKASAGDKGQAFRHTTHNAYVLLLFFIP